jgi:hypothetical protein
MAIRNGSVHPHSRIAVIDLAPGTAGAAIAGSTPAPGSAAAWQNYRTQLNTARTQATPGTLIYDPSTAPAAIPAPPSWSTWATCPAGSTDDSSPAGTFAAALTQIGQAPWYAVAGGIAAVLLILEAVSQRKPAR